MRPVTVLKSMAGASAAIAAYHFALRPWTAKWGVTDDELCRTFPGDALLPSPVHVVTHGVTIEAPAEAIWPYIVQLGQDRAGFYSYTPLENLFGARMRNVYRIVPEFQQRAVGDFVWMADPQRFNGMGKMRVAVLDPPRAIVMQCVDDGFGGDGTWGLYLDDSAKTRTRFICRQRSGRKASVVQSFFDYAFWEPAHFVMERKMMLTIKALAEGELLADDVKGCCTSDADLLVSR